ncbi:MAG: hypothetical protein KC620_00670 [Myxococcales bacterium]|nr:hypothetical protein [Myxococcales bacterium]
MKTQRLVSTLIASTALTLLAVAPAAADNHLLLELEGGVTTAVGGSGDAEPGHAIGATFGIGGRIPGFSPAYYLVGRVAAADHGLRGPEVYGGPAIERDQSEWALGARIYLPISERLRALFQIAAGETSDTSDVKYYGERPLRYESELFTIFTEAGLQYRFTNNFSLGAVADLAYFPDQAPFDMTARSAGMEDGGEFGRARFAVTTTFHF